MRKAALVNRYTYSIIVLELRRRLSLGVVADETYVSTENMSNRAHSNIVGRMERESKYIFL